MPLMVRADALSGFEALATSLGGDPASLLADAGLTLPMLAQSERYIPQRRFVLALEVAAQRLGRPDFGMRLGAGQSIGILGPLAVGLENAATVQEVFALVERYSHVHDQALRFSHYPLRDPEHYLFSLDYRVRSARPMLQVHELALVVAASVLARLVGDSAALAGIWMAHQPMSAPETYARYLPCPVHFCQPVSGLLLKTSMLQRPLPGRGEDRARWAQAYLQQHFSQRAPSVVTRVTALMRPLLPLELCTQDYVAKVLAMHPRTLHRQLANEGTTFGAIKAVQRRLWARELLEQGLPAGHISGLLGFRFDSAFSLACKEWFGAGPRALRGKAKA